MSAADVKDTLALAIDNCGVDTITVLHRLLLLSDNDAGYGSKDSQVYIADRDIAHTRGKPYYPVTQGKR